MRVANKSKKVNRTWLNDHIHDPYVQRAQIDGYRARAAYKLKEIDEHFKLIHSGDWVLDLGSAPGAWSQYLRRKLTPQGSNGNINGRIIALDLLPMEVVEGVHFLQGDFRQDGVAQALHALLGERKLDAIVSDMAPNLSGIASADGARIADLIELAVAFAQQHLKSDGVLLLKMFHGSGYSQLVEHCKRHFRSVKPYKPKASRDKSRETFLLAIGPKKQAPN